MNETKPDSSLLGIPLAHGNLRKVYHDLAAPPRSLPLRLKWNLLVGGFRHQRAWLIALALLSLFGVGVVFLHRVARLEPEPGFLGWSLTVLLVLVTPFIVMILHAGRRRVRLFQRGKLAFGELSKAQTTGHQCTWGSIARVWTDDNHSLDYRLEQLTVRWTRYEFMFSFLAEDGNTCNATALTNDTIWRPLKDEKYERIIYDPANPTEAVVVDEFAPWAEIDESGRFQIPRGAKWIRDLMPALLISFAIVVDVGLLFCLSPQDEPRFKHAKASANEDDRH